MDRDNTHRKDYNMVKVLRCCNHKPNDKCDATGADAPYAHEYFTFKDDGKVWQDEDGNRVYNLEYPNDLGDYKPRHLSYHHNKVFTSQDALNLAISHAEKLEKELGVQILVSESPA